MKTFESPTEFSAYLQRQVALVPARIQRSLGVIGTMVRDEARHRIGQYQAADGVFNTWAQLSPVTQDDRQARGFSRNKPLYRSGALRRAVTSEVLPMQVIIGVKSGPGPDYDSGKDIGDIARWMEFGTVQKGGTAPPRPFLGPALLSKWDEIEGLLSRGLVGALTGGFVFGYGSPESRMIGSATVRMALRAGFAQGKITS